MSQPAMSKFHAIYTDYPWADCDLERSILAEVDCDLTLTPGEDEPTLIEAASNADVIITCWAQVTGKVIEAASKCRHIARTGIGLDNIDVEVATKRGIIVTNVPDYCIPEVVDHTLALLFSLARKIHVYHQAAQAGVYDRLIGLPLERMEDQTVGIVGTGRIGSVAAKRCAALGMRTVVNNRSQRAVEGCEWLELDELLKVSDYVVLLCPLTDETEHLISSRTLSLMKPTAFLINTSRGGLVDHAALAAALEANEIAGAGLDVQTPEPPDLSQPPYNDPRVIVTPHAAFYSTRATHELRSRVANQIATYLRGETPDNVVNPEVL